MPSDCLSWKPWAASWDKEALYRLLQRRLPWQDFPPHPLWVADYDVNQPESTGPWDSWDGFQYSDRGRVPGVNGDVDMDFFKDSMFIISRTPQPEPNPGDMGVLLTYKVQGGDTLWSISRRFGTTVDRLAELNHISNPNIISGDRFLRFGYSRRHHIPEKRRSSGPLQTVLAPAYQNWWYLPTQ